MKPLFIPLKTEYFNGFADGTKDTEYRVHGPRWNRDTCAVGRPVVLSKGYGKQARLYGHVEAFRVEDEPKHLKGWVDCYGDTELVAACIKIRLAPQAGESR